MTSIFSGQLYRNFVKDQNTFRLESYDVNRFQKTVQQQASQGQREKTLREGLEFHQAIMADLQTKLSEVTEKLNNLYRRFIDNQVAFLKASSSYPATSTQNAVAGLPRVDDPAFPNTGGYPAGASNILPFDDFDKIRNYSYNPYFGSKAVEKSDKNVIRTFWEEPGVTDENAYRENGAFWSTISYLWGWDLDRINATYTTGDSIDKKENRQINVTALQPNKPQYPPLKPGDRFPLNWIGGGGPVAGYPAVNITGIRPGGADYSHATDTLRTGGESTAIFSTANIVGPAGNGSPGNGFFVDDASFLAVNDAIVVGGTTGLTNRQITSITPAPIPGFPNRAEISTAGFTPYGSPISSGTITKQTGGSTSKAELNTVGKDEVNMGWEFDDLPVSMEVTGVETRPDGTTVPTGYKVVYDIPPTHPFYNELKVLNGTEPQIEDAPVDFHKTRINNVGFDYTGTAFIPGTSSSDFEYSAPYHSSGVVGPDPHPNGTEGEYRPPRNFNNELLGSIVLNTCNPISINTNTSISMKYRFAVHQHPLVPGSPGDEILPIPPDSGLYGGHDWNSAGNEQLGGTGASYAVPNPLANNLPYSVITNAPMGAGPVLIGTSPSPKNLSFDAYNPTGPGSNEKMTAKIVQTGSNQVTLEFYFTGDISNANIEVQDVQIVTYNSSPGGLHTWEQGLYQADPAGADAKPVIGMGNFSAPGIQGPLNPGEADVINKYYPNVFQFTQFTDSYNISHAPGVNNDILRSPWEFADLSIGAGSGLSGELWVDINGQRINLAHDVLQSTVGAWAENTVAVQNPTGGDYLASAAVQAATDFTAVVTYPDDNCGTGDHKQQFTDSDPLNNVALRTDTQTDEILETEPQVAPVVAPLPADPGRTSNPTYTYNNFGNFYDFTNLGPPATQSNTAGAFITGGSNDTTGTADRMHASDGNFTMQLSIPTSDVNVLKNENNVLFNFGAIPDRDYSINIKNPNLDVRTISGYKTVPRYRVDAGGNIYDQFGKGYYDNTIASDLASIGRIYTSAGGTNGQISNADHSYGTYATNYAGAGSYEAWVNNHDRLSMGNAGGATGKDDFNLFDYTPDLNFNPNSKEGGRYGESYVGSLPSNFYYYRQTLDQSLSETGTPPPTGNNPAPAGGGGPLTFNNDDKPALNFDGHGANLNGLYNAPHTYVYNAETPSFANVKLGSVEQDARYSNTARTGTYAVWQDFPGLNVPLSYAISVDPAPRTTNVTNPTNALGESPTTFASLDFPTSTLQVDMGSVVNNAGYLVVNEMGVNGPEAHEVPLPLLTQPGPYPSYTGAVPSTYTFDAYGSGTVTRTGSKFMSFSSLLDEADGTTGGFTGTPDNQSLLEAAGGQFATGGTYNRANASTWPPGVLLHVDNVDAFDLTYPKNVVVLGNNPTRYVITYRNNQTEPKTLFLVRDDGSSLAGGTLTGATTTANFVQADLQVKEVSGSYTVSVVNSAGALDVNGSHVKIDYTDNGTQRPGKIVNVGLSTAMDRVGRIPGDDPRTPGVEAQAITPELFASPKGYVQPDAQVDLHVVSEDKDGNKKPRKLKSVKVEVVSGEQIIPTDLQQVYTTYDDGTGFSLTGGGGAGNNWPIAVYDGNTQINPLVTPDLNYMVGYYQGITAGSTTTQINVVDATDFKIGHKVTINGEQRTITNITGNQLTLDKALANVPLLGDRVDLGDGSGEHDLKLFLNRSFAMSMGAGLKVTCEYEEYDYVGYPPTVDKSAPTTVTEVLGFSDKKPKDVLTISPTNTGTGAAGNGIQVSGTLASYAVGDKINVNGDTFKIKAIVGSTIELGDYTNNTADAFNPPPKGGSITHADFENFLVAGKGRSGGSASNEFTQELKRIVDNPEYKELFRHNLFKDIFITASVNDPFNDLISSKLFLNWDRLKREVEIQQSSYVAYFKSG